ncbi:hypothetical protein CPB86DRAFT_707172 [Serendipita vermifera]|nr:hypothetical protein CPB86DRAFT_707172 [Serendipita vermifera]
MSIVLTINTGKVVLEFRKESNSSPISSRTSDSKRNELGFKELSPGQDPVVDIVAIHGLDGHRERSWTATSGTMWLKDLLPLDIPNARILTYGYDADTRRFTYTSTQSIFRHAETFVADLTLARSGNPERPIIFVAHSLGGIILKKALALCNGANHKSDYKSIRVSTFAILFFGTPHSGANGVELAQWMGKLLSVYMFTDNTILKDLSRDSDHLQSIQAFYLDASEGIKSIFFYEALPTPLMKGIAELIVPRRLAIIEGDRNAKVVELHRDHCDMVKFQGREENDYRKVVGYLSKLMGEAPVEIERSWSKERHLRSIANGEVHSPAHTILSKPRLPVSRNYVERPHIQDFLTKKLLPSHPPRVQPRCVLHGLGGSGKTQAASFWIEENKHRFTRIIFIDATNQRQIEADLEIAIRSVGPEWSESTWKDAVAYLSGQKGWLLFFDNADTPDLGLRDYFPSSTFGSILITTRNQDCVDYAPDGHIQVGEMLETEAIDLLHKVANVYPSSNDTSVAIVKELGMLALAITQAGAYIFKTRGLNKFLDTFRKHRVELMREPSLKNRDYDRSTYTAFDLSFGLLPEKAQLFMKICAFFHHSHIPQELFEKSINNRFRYYDEFYELVVPRTGNPISNLENIFGSEWDDFHFQKLIGPILQGSLMDGSTDEHEQVFYNIHPLLQTYIRDLLPPDDQNHYALSARQLLLGWIREWKDQPDPDYNPTLLPHVDSLPISVKAVYVYPQIFTHIYRSAGWPCADLDLWEYCDIHRDKDPKRGDYIIICTKANPGVSIDTCAKLEEAERLERELLKIRSEGSALRNSRKSAMEDLAIRLGCQLEMAEKILRKALELRQEILGPHHPYNVVAIHTLATIFRKCGPLEEAEKFMRESLELGMRLLGPEHSYTTKIMQETALILYERNKLEEAEKMLREAVEFQKKDPGPQHDETTWSMYRLSFVLIERGRLEEAEKVDRELVEFAEPLEPWHVRRVGAIYNLASTLVRRGQLKEAEKMMREVLELLEESALTNYYQPFHLAMMHNLAVTLGESDKLEEAEKMMREFLRRHSAPQGHPRWGDPKWTSAMHGLFIILLRRGQLEEAGNMTRKILQVPELWEVQPPVGASRMFKRIVTLARRGQLEKAEKILGEALRVPPPIFERYLDGVPRPIILDWGQLKRDEEVTRDFEDLQMDLELRALRILSTIRHSMCRFYKSIRRSGYPVYFRPFVTSCSRTW